MLNRTGLADADGKKSVLILYDHREVHVKTIADYLESFQRYSLHNVSYASSLARCRFDLNYFDAVLLHYSVRVCNPGCLSASFAAALRGYAGLKGLFIQDEYENTNVAQQAILDLGIQLVFSCVPEESLAKVYPPERFAGVKFSNVLTGFVPLELSQLQGYAPIRQRSVLIGYRGRNLGFWYGDLGQEKQKIGERMRAICQARGLKTDISSAEKDRIYGPGWFDFLGRCKATLGTESGANIFDFDGTLRRAVLAELRRRPQVTYEEIRALYLQDHEGRIVMNQISPKVFEAIACGTALVLFEGRYSGVLEPHRHFLPLKKDFSNVDEVLVKLQDDAFLEAMAERAYADIIGSGRYSYRAFVSSIDEVLARNWRRVPREKSSWLPLPPCDALPEFRNAYRKNFVPTAFRGAGVKRLWSRMPEPIRGALRPFLHKLYALVKPAY